MLNEPALCGSLDLCETILHAKGARISVKPLGGSLDLRVCCTKKHVFF